MTNFKINRKSWHYKLLTYDLSRFDVQDFEERHKDFCSYFGALTFDLIRYALLFLVLAIAGIILIIAGIYHIGLFAITDPITFFSMISGGAFTIGLLFFANWLSNNQ